VDKPSICSVKRMDIYMPARSLTLHHASWERQISMANSLLTYLIPLRPARPSGPTVPPAAHYGRPTKVKARPGRAAPTGPQAPGRARGSPRVRLSPPRREPTPCVADHMREPRRPANPDHLSQDPALHRPAVQDGPPHQSSTSQHLGRRRQPEPGWGHRGGGVAATPPAGTADAPAVPRACRRRGAAASYSATRSGQ
jgi:hypothetical protein